MCKRPIYAAFLMTASLVGPAAAHDELVSARFTARAGPNAYTVTFPAELGGMQIVMPITGGQFTLSLNEEEGTARLVAWRQDIEPIAIAGYGTGPITVTMDLNQPSSGIYQPESRSFEVSATFVLEFDDSELQALGFTSPFSLRAVERGVRFGSGKIGVIRMSLEGTGQFGLGEFSYTCDTSGEIEYDVPPHLVQPGDTNHDRRFDVSDAVGTLWHLFMGGEITCPGAVEVNGDARNEVGDAIYMLSFLFQGGAPPPPEPVVCAP